MNDIMKPHVFLFFLITSRTVVDCVLACRWCNHNHAGHAWQLPRGMNILVANFGLVQIIRSVGLHAYGSSCGMCQSARHMLLRLGRAGGCVAVLKQAPQTKLEVVMTTPCCTTRESSCGILYYCLENNKACANNAVSLVASNHFNLVLRTCHP